MNLYLVNSQDDPISQELDDSLNREFRLEQKLLILKIVFWVSAVWFLGTIVYCVITPPASWLFFFVFLVVSLVWFRIFYHWIERTKKRIDVECIIQKNLLSRRHP